MTTNNNVNPATRQFIDKIKTEKSKDFIFYPPPYNGEKPDNQLYYTKAVIKVSPGLQFPHVWCDVECNLCKSKITRKGFNTRYRRVECIKNSMIVLQDLYSCKCNSNSDLTALKILFKEKDRFSNIPDFVVGVN